MCSASRFTVKPFAVPSKNATDVRLAHAAKTTKRKMSLRLLGCNVVSRYHHARLRRDNPNPSQHQNAKCVSIQVAISSVRQSRWPLKTRKATVAKASEISKR